MKKNKFFVLLTVFIFIANVSNATYMTTATSISWSGAYSSIADGFEAVLYNPAGVYMTNGKLGLNILGTYSLKFYNNLLSTKNVIDILNKSISHENLTSYFRSMVSAMPMSGFTTGLEMSLLNFISYFKFKHFGLGISILPKTKFDISLGKSLFSTVFDSIDLTKKNSYTGSATLLEYFDFNGSISTRFKLLEQLIPVEKIYVGIGTHVYIPTVFFSGVIDEASIQAIKGSNALGMDDYRVKLKGSASLCINKAIPDNLSQYGVLGNNTFSQIVTDSGTVGFGIGFDMGTIVQIKKWVKVGFSVTDLGFITFPEHVGINVNYTGDLTLDMTNPANIGSAFTNFGTSMIDSLSSSVDSLKRVTTVTAFMPDTALRLGVAFTPVLNKYISVVAAADISVTDLNKCINGGYAVFNFATGAEVLPTLGWFQFMFRTAFSYSTEANFPCFSLGTGLYLGALRMELAVKGLEVLFKDIGARQIAIGADLKFVF